MPEAERVPTCSRRRVRGGRRTIRRIRSSPSTVVQSAAHDRLYAVGRLNRTLVFPHTHYGPGGVLQRCVDLPVPFLIARELPIPPFAVTGGAGRMLGARVPE